MDPFALPCHPERRISPDDRDWRAIGVKSADDVLRKQTRCPDCTTSYTAFLRGFGQARTVEWLRPAPFRVTAAPVDGGPVWQLPEEGSGSAGPLPPPDVRRERLQAMQDATAALGAGWDRSAQLVVAAYELRASDGVVAEAGELLLERREKWNAQDRRLALLWSPRVERPVVAWHGFARLLQD